MSDTPRPSSPENALLRAWMRCPRRAWRLARGLAGPAPEGLAWHREVRAAWREVLGDAGDEVDADVVGPAGRWRADALRELPGGVAVHAVKATTRPDRVHRDELAAVAWAVQASGRPVAAAALHALDARWRLPAAGLDAGLFRTRTEPVAPLLRRGEELVRRMRADLAGAEPAPRPACGQREECPTDCPRKERPPADPAGVEAIGPGLRAALSGWPEPVVHLDLELVATAIPRWVGVAPFEPVVVQWSAHVEEPDGARPLAWLYDGRGDPRPEAAATLAEAVAGAGTVAVWSHQEVEDLQKLAPFGPPGWHGALRPRLLELRPRVQAHWRHPQLGGSTSLKAVLRALRPELDHARLAIHDGRGAAVAWRQLVEGHADAPRLRAELAEYGALDTFAMVAVRRALLARA